MDFETATLDEIKIIGIDLKTSNTTAQNDISKLWERFYSESVLEKIKGKISEDIYSVYTDYEGDYTKPYRLILGCQVNDAENMMHIWNSNLDRTYRSDFDLHSTTSKPPAVHVYVGIN